MTAPGDPTRPVGGEAGRPDPAAPRTDTSYPDASRTDAPRAEAPSAEPTRPADAPTGRRAAERPAAERPAPAESTSEAPAGGGGKTAGVWIGLILGAIVLVLLLIFVIQNNQTARFDYFSAQFDLPLGVAMLLAAIAGALIMALVGSVRMFQMSWTIRKLRKQQEKIHRATR